MLVSSYFCEMQLRTERGDPRCTLFHTRCAPAVAGGGGLNHMD